MVPPVVGWDGVFIFFAETVALAKPGSGFAAVTDRLAQLICV
jgi:hypothetical protein